jgi:hypothetical protein
MWGHAYSFTRHVHAHVHVRVRTSQCALPLHHSPFGTARTERVARARARDEFIRPPSTRPPRR